MVQWFFVTQRFAEETELHGVLYYSLRNSFALGASLRNTYLSPKSNGANTKLFGYSPRCHIFQLLASQPINSSSLTFTCSADLS